MPAKDHYHDTVIRALRKDRWQITGEQVALKIEGRRLWVDIAAQKGNNGSSILLEVKDLENRSSSVDALSEAVGQYSIYKAILRYTGLTSLQLFLAVPANSYYGILSEKIGQIAIQTAAMSIAVFDTEQEVFTQWLPYQTS